MDSNDAAIFNASMQTLNNSASIASTNRMNRKTREWNEKVMGQQRQWALDDWNMQNEYNHPSSQMARLREAGLNPHLVYGKGADNTSGMVRSSESPQWNPKAPEFNFGSPFSEMYDFEMKQAQIDNLRVLNTVSQQEALLKAAQTANVAQSTQNSSFDLDQKHSLSQYVLEAAAANVKKMNADIDFTHAQNRRADFDSFLRYTQTSSSVAEAASRMLSEQSRRATDAKTRAEIDQRIKNLESDNEIKKLDIELKKTGVQPHDKLWQRKLFQAWPDIKKAIMIPDSTKKKYMDIILSDSVRKKYPSRFDNYHSR